MHHYSFSELMERDCQRLLSMNRARYRWSAVGLFAVSAVVQFAFAPPSWILATVIVVLMALMCFVPALIGFRPDIYFRFSTYRFKTDFTAEELKIRDRIIGTLKNASQ